MQLVSIARVTFVEAVRQPIFVVLILAGALLMVVNPSMSAYSMEPGAGDNKMLVDLGLGTVWLVGMALAAFTATGVVNQEMESKTALTVVSKPVPRPVFIFGKYLGVSGAIVIAAYLLLLVFLFTLRHRVLQNAGDRLDGPVLLFGVGGLVLALVIAAAGNYLYNKVFTSTFTYALLCTLTAGFALVTVINKEWGFQGPATDFVADGNRMGEIAIGGVLIIEGLLLLTAIAVALSTRFSQVITLLACAVVLILGMMSGTLSQLVNSGLGIAADASLVDSVRAVLDADVPGVRKALYLLAKAMYVVAPNFQFHWPADAITQGHSLVYDQDENFTLSYIGTVTAYSAMYITAVLGLAVVLFQKREVS